MCQLFQACRLCFHMIGIRFSVPRRGYPVEIQGDTDGTLLDQSVPRGVPVSLLFGTLGHLILLSLSRGVPAHLLASCLTFSSLAEMFGVFLLFADPKLSHIEA